jgi:hypothetical protein
LNSRIIEATQAGDKPFNWGKFLVATFDESEWAYVSAIAGSPLLARLGYTSKMPGILVLDLATREGSYFYPQGSAVNDLRDRQIWVCPLYEPFLCWLYANFTGTLADLPGVVYLENAPAAIAGYRRPGKRKRR